MIKKSVITGRGEEVRFRFSAAAAAAAILLSMFSACSTFNGKAASGHNSRDKSAAALSSQSIPDSQTDASVQQVPSSGTAVDVVSDAKTLGSSPGRLALAIIINRIDGTTAIDDLARKNAQELFDILRQTASQKSETLESLDQIYYLSDILASEKIYVLLQSNNVVSSKAASYDANWAEKFDKSVNSPQKK